MALINCSECTKKISDKAAFCPHCGNPMEQKSLKTCSKCNYANEFSSDFCINCGESLKTKTKKICPKCSYENQVSSEFCENCGNKLILKKSTGWNFDSKILSISFLISAIFATYLLATPSIVSDILENSTFLGILAIIIGILILFLNKTKEKFSIAQEIETLKSLKLSRYQVALIFIIAGIIIFLEPGKNVRGDTFAATLILICSFFTMCANLVIMNWNKLGWIYEAITLLISIAFFGASAYLRNHGNELNNNLNSQLESVWETGVANPGDQYINFATYTLIAGVVFLILFILMLIKKKD